MPEIRSVRNIIAEGARAAVKWDWGNVRRHNRSNAVVDTRLTRGAHGPEIECEVCLEDSGSERTKVLTGDVVGEFEDRL
jgi:hypothetical protein